MPQPVTGGVNQHKMFGLFGFFVQSVGVAYLYRLVLVTVYEQKGVGGNLVYALNRADLPKTIEPFFAGWRKIIVPDGTDAAKMVNGRFRFIEEIELCRTGTGDDG